MTHQLAAVEHGPPPIPHDPEARHKLIQTLKASLYPGAKDESVELVLGYCESARLDPMQKPVHIVPMYVRNENGRGGGMRDVVMPGIGLYRIQAQRSGDVAGMDAPIFGEMVERSLIDKDGGGVTVRFPEWCEVTVYKVVAGQRVGFTAREYWEENYATDSRQSTAPNAMWRKRPRAQLAKCAEAQALRKGWPEVGQAPTAEEMEGKELDMGAAERVAEAPAPERTAQALPDLPDEHLEAGRSTWSKKFADGTRTPKEIIAKLQTKYRLTEAQEQFILDLKGETDADS